ncbi:MAG: AAA family ATPase [Phycisphaerales bacterium]|nr:AAA family ATPase [Phycisphaerales bacterium]
MTRRLIDASIALGLPLRALAKRPALDARQLALHQSIAREIAAFAASQSPSVILITGASGTGKSTLLRGVRRELRDRGVRCVRPRALTTRDSTTRVIDLSPTSAPSLWLRQLGDAGLAEARLLNRLPRELSEGQRARLSLAIALASTHRDRRRRVLLADEFLAVLDRATAMSCASSIARAVRRDSDRPRSLIVCTSHDDLGDALCPDMHVHLHPHRSPAVHTRASAAPDQTTPQAGETP